MQPFTLSVIADHCGESKSGVNRWAKRSLRLPHSLRLFIITIGKCGERLPPPLYYMMQKADSIKPGLLELILLVDELSQNSQHSEDKEIYVMYLAHAAIILAKIEKGRDCMDDVGNAEKVFAQKKLKDSHAYATVYKSWSELAEMITQPSLEGLGMNERLLTLGLLSQFDDAVESRDVVMMRSILEKCKYTDADIDGILESELGGG
jgi:hypothetical protein